MPNPSDLTVPAMEAKRLAELRQRAASQLGGAMPVPGLPTSSAQAMGALSVLHALASSPHTASDALTLLHELQVHQVELDLQAQELQDSRAQLEAALRRQIELFDFQPVGLFVLDARGVVLEVNHTGAALLGLGREDALGMPLVGFLSAQSTGRFDAAMASITAGLAQAQCTLQLRTLHGAGCEVLAGIGKDPGQTGFLVTLLFSGRQPEDHPDPR